MKYDDEWSPPRPPAYLTRFEAFTIAMSILVAFAFGTFFGAAVR